MALLDILGRRWTLRILWELRAGPVGFRDLAARADSMSQSVLSKRLKELETVCLAVGDDEGWHLTRDGVDLLELLLPLSEFAGRWAARVTPSAAGDASTSNGNNRAGNRQRGPAT